MKREFYDKLYRELFDKSSMTEVAEKYGVDKELLMVILDQKMTRAVMRNYYRMEANSKNLHNQWKRGRTILQIAKYHNFSPVLTAGFIMKQMGKSKKEIQRLLKNPELVQEPRLKRELREAVRQDIVYSDWAHRMQKLRGRRGEEKIQKWLEKREIKFQTECDLKGNEEKTPDFLLDEPYKEINWIESKASFGDDKKVQRDLKRQLEPYKILYGPGMVVYWFGFIDDISLKDKDVKIVDEGYFKG